MGRNREACRETALSGALHFSSDRLFDNGHAKTAKKRTLDLLEGIGVVVSWHV